MRTVISRPERHLLPLLCYAVAGHLLFMSTAFAQQEIETVEVVGTTPLGAEIDLDRIGENGAVASLAGLPRCRL